MNLISKMYQRFLLLQCIILILIGGLFFSPLIAQDEEDEDDYYEDEYYDDEEEYDDEDDYYEEDEYEDEEEYIEESYLSGFKAGVSIGYPVATGTYMEKKGRGLNLGLIASTPYGFFLGPFNVGVGAELMMYSFPGTDDSPSDYSGIAFLATINTSLNDIMVDEFPYQLEFRLGGGFFGGGLGTTIGGSFDYQLADIPLIIGLFIRGNATAQSGKGGPAGGKEPTGWIAVGVLLNYDISTFF